ncbi:MAG: orotidine-5'-phosphate decarboxylase [Phycisphaeraceae bacterium]
MSFADRLSEAVRERQSQVVIGLDPDPGRLIPAAHAAAGDGSPAERSARAVTAHCAMMVEAAGTACVAVKLQSACFERLGAPGWSALSSCVDLARDAGLLAIVDAKRGDVPHTATAYAQALVGGTETPWGEVRGLEADAVTASPLLGRDSLAPIIAAAHSANAGVFVLVRTSNPGASEIQDVTHGVGESPLHERLARIVDALGSGTVGSSGLSDVGAVVAATQPDLLERLRRDMPSAILLMPGVGAQGGDVADLAAAFAPGRAAGLIAVSRSIVDPAIESGDVSRARDAAERLREQVWELSG